MPSYQFQCRLCGRVHNRIFSMEKVPKAISCGCTPNVREKRHYGTAKRIITAPLIKVSNPTNARHGRGQG